MPIYKIAGEKRGSLQMYRVVVNWTEDGKKRTKERRVAGKTQAELEEAKIRAEIENGLPEKKKSEHKHMTVQQLWDLYEAEHGPEVRASTMAKKKSIVANHIIPDLGPKAVRYVSEEDLTAWRAKLNASPMKASTKNGAYREIRALFNFAVQRKIIEHSPLKAIKPFRDPYKETAAVKIRYYTKEEFLRYIGAAKADAEEKDTLRAWGIYIFFMLAYYTGARKGEINGLRWTDVDGAYLWIRRSITQKLKGSAWAETPPKNESSVRRIQMPGQLISALTDHRRRQERSELFAEALFICGGLRPLPDTVIEDANKTFCEAAGVKHITIHEFRHSHASLLCNAGINIQEVARRLGHADAEMTLKTYAHLYPAEEERAVAVLNSV